MTSEKINTFEQETQQALDIVAPSDESAAVIPFPVDRVRPVELTGNEDHPIPHHETHREPTTVEARPSGKNILGVVGGVGAAALLALGFAPRGHDAPTPVPETFTDQVQEAAQIPYNPATDELVIDGIRVIPGATAKNTPSEAVLSNPRVQEYIAAHPNEASSLETSSLSLPSSESDNFAVVERDVDSDGDTDAIAVPVK